MKKIVVTVSMAWNLALVVGVVFNKSFALTRAAGGQYENFPTAIRVAYVVTAALLIWQYRTLLNLWGHRSINPTWLPRLFLVISLLSAIVNALSRSSNERWNVIPALIITYAFWQKPKVT